MRLGAPVFTDSDDPDELARAHRNRGLRAAFCPDISLADHDRVRATREAFARHDVVIAEVGVWNNLMDADPAQRRANIREMCDGLALAEEVGALCCVNIAGSRSSKRWDGPHADNFSRGTFETAVANAREIIDTVRPKRAKLSYEMMPWALPDSVESSLELISAVDRPAFAAHLDVANLVNSPRRYFGSAALIRDCCSKLGPWIVSCHLKDVWLGDKFTVHVDEVPPGDGGLDLKTYLQEVSRLPHHPPILLEHLATPEEYDLAGQYVLALAEEIGITM